MIGDRRRLVLPRRRSAVNQKFMIRKCFVMQLKHGTEEKYRQRHSPIWKELEEVLRKHGVHNYSIALHSKPGSYLPTLRLKMKPAGTLLPRRQPVAVGGIT